MKFTLSWLKQPLETNATLDEITERLTMLGLEVESVEDPAKKLAVFSVAKVLEAKPHPDADKLQVLKVEALVEGEVKQLQVVCGAPNARAGLTGVFAPPGATIPVSGMVLKPTKIRGVEIERHDVFGARARTFRRSCRHHRPRRRLEDRRHRRPRCSAATTPSSKSRSRRTAPIASASMASRAIWQPPASAACTKGRSRRSTENSKALSV